MQKGDYLASVLRSPKTVFTTQDIALLWQDGNAKAIKVRLNYYVKNSDLYRIRRGLYAKSSDFNRHELATRVFTPSYISFETVLLQTGLIFQYQSGLTLASYLTREITIDGQTYFYRKIKNEILINISGVSLENETALASKERAFLDTLYLNGNFHFDNLRSLDWDKVMEFVPIYENMRLKKTVDRIFKETKTQPI